MQNFLKRLEERPQGSVSAVIWGNQVLVVANDIAIAAVIEQIAYSGQFDDLEIRLYFINRERETAHFMFVKRPKKIC